MQNAPQTVFPLTKSLQGWYNKEKYDPYPWIRTMMEENMPYIATKVTTPLTKETTDRLSAAYGKLIALFPGKTERWLMLDFTGDARMTFAGTDEPCAMIEVALFGKADDASYDKMTAAVCDLIEKECAIPGDRIYVKYEEVEHWGWNGGNF